MGTRYIGKTRALHATLHIPPCEYWAAPLGKTGQVNVLCTGCGYVLPSECGDAAGGGFLARVRLRASSRNRPRPLAAYTESGNTSSKPSDAKLAHSLLVSSTPYTTLTPSNHWGCEAIPRPPGRRAITGSVASDPIGQAEHLAHLLLHSVSDTSSMPAQSVPVDVDVESGRWGCVASCAPTTQRRQAGGGAADDSPSPPE